MYFIFNLYEGDLWLIVIDKGLGNIFIVVLLGVEFDLCVIVCMIIVIWNFMDFEIGEICDYGIWLFVEIGDGMVVWKWIVVEGGFFVMV